MRSPVTGLDGRLLVQRLVTCSTTGGRLGVAPDSGVRACELGPMNSSETLMLSGIAAVCPDCGDERIFVEVAETEYCCTTCDAAVLLVDVLPMTTRLSRAS